ncbi:YihY/virulence factor BrkB family protein [Peptostreptococcus faecalis]|uniref:YihY/virulence factor BrkB family protein n=1 Tax=Peptostreptococcus faecalis TaxID=2045015 RepID=UPI0015E09687|nr:YihY/virulence factor BrkB family protein [Peptostreptococcus faecalis]
MSKLRKILKPLIKQFNVPDMYSRTAEVAFYLMLSIFPSLIFLICAIAYIPDVGLIKTQVFVQQFIPEDATEIIHAIISSAIANRSLRLLIISFLLATWTFSNAVKSLIKGQNMAFGFEEKRPFLKLNAYCLIYSVAFFIMILLCVIFLVYGNKLGALLLSILGDNIIIRWVYKFIQYTIPIVIMTYIFLNFFTIGPSGSLKYRYTIPGAAVTTFLWLLFSLFYSAYTENFGQFREIYGSISSIIILMTWIYLCSMSMIIGYKLNAIIYLQEKVDKFRFRRVK